MSDLTKGLGSLEDMLHPKVPKEFASYAEDDGSSGKGAALLPRPWNTHSDLLLGAGFDPRAWRINGLINTRKWQGVPGGPFQYYYRFDVVAGEAPEVAQAHISELIKEIRRRRRTIPSPCSGTDAWAYFMSDLQLGKAEGKNGTDQTVDRVLESFDLAEARIKSLRKGGAFMPTGVLFGLGDIVESCSGFYANQTFTVDRNRRDQNVIARELISKGIDRFLPLFDRLIVGSVGGNHGENRGNSGKAFTDDADNDDVAVFEAVKEAFDRAGEDRIEWYIPYDELSMQLQLGGVGVGLTHGHLFKGGLTPLAAQRGAHAWWSGQEFGMQPIRGAQVLVSGHFHHFSANTFGVRTAIQAPACDPGSQWVTNAIGEAAPAAVLTMRFDASEPLGFADLALLSPRIVEGT